MAKNNKNKTKNKVFYERFFGSNCIPIEREFFSVLQVQISAV
jgi:hypothetical protein